MRVNQQAKLHNRFDIEVRDAKTGEVKQRAQAENMILNALWTRLLSGAPYFAQIRVGTGAGTLSAARTSLFTDLAGKAATNATGQLDMAAGYASLRQQIQFLENEIVGSTLTEVGIASAVGASYLVTHAMLKDMNGNPVSLLKTDTDIITIYATVYCVFPPAGWDGGHVHISVPLANVTSNSLMSWILGAQAVASSVLFSILESPTRKDSNLLESYLYEIGAATRTYDVANKKLTVYARCPAASANGIGFKSITLGNTLHLSARDSTVFPGSTVIGDALGTGDGTTLDFKTTFGNVKAGAKVYLDGVEQTTGVTVDVGKPGFADIITELKTISRTNFTLSVGSGASTGTPGTLIFENPLHATYGLDGLFIGKGSLYSSDDMVAWELTNTLASNTGTVTIPAGHRNKRYWKLEATDMYNFCRSAVSNDLTATTVKNIHFATPPASGAVITADYDTSLIAKDINHVTDITFVLQFAEYIP